MLQNLPEPTHEAAFHFELVWVAMVIYPVLEAHKLCQQHIQNTIQLRVGHLVTVPGGGKGMGQGVGQGSLWMLCVSL